MASIGVEQGLDRPDAYDNELENASRRQKGKLTDTTARWETFIENYWKLFLRSQEGQSERDRKDRAVDALDMSDKDILISRIKAYNRHQLSKTKGLKGGDRPTRKTLMKQSHDLFYLFWYRLRSSGLTQDEANKIIGAPNDWFKSTVRGTINLAIANQALMEEFDLPVTQEAGAVFGRVELDLLQKGKMTRGGDSRPGEQNTSKSHVAAQRLLRNFRRATAQRVASIAHNYGKGSTGCDSSRAAAAPSPFDEEQNDAEELSSDGEETRSDGAEEESSEDVFELDANVDRQTTGRRAAREPTNCNPLGDGSSGSEGSEAPSAFKLITDAGFGDQSPFVTAAARRGMIAYLVALKEGPERLEKVVDIIPFLSHCTFYEWTANFGCPRHGAWSRLLDANAASVNPRRYAIRQHIRQQHPDLYAAIRMGRQINERAFAGPGLPVPMPTLIDHHAPDVAARFAVPLEPGQKGTVEAAKAIQWATPMLSLFKPEADGHQR